MGSSVIVERTGIGDELDLDRAGNQVSKLRRRLRGFCADRACDPQILEKRQRANASAA